MTTSATFSRRQKEKEDRKDAILSAAREVFFMQGIRRTTVDDIASKAKVAKGTVYLYFETKETILAHLLLEGLDSLLQRLEKSYQEPIPLTAEARVRQIAWAYFKFFKEEQDYFRLMMAFDRGHFQEAVNPELYEMILRRSVRSLRWLIRAMDVGIKTNEFIDRDPEDMAGMLWAALNGVLVLFSHPLRRELLEREIETLYDGVLETMLTGMRKITTNKQ